MKCNVYKCFEAPSHAHPRPVHLHLKNRQAHPSPSEEQERPRPSFHPISIHVLSMAAAANRGAAPSSCALPWPVRRPRSEPPPPLRTATALSSTTRAANLLRHLRAGRTMAKCSWPCATRPSPAPWRRRSASPRRFELDPNEIGEIQGWGGTCGRLGLVPGRRNPGRAVAPGRG